MGGIEGIKKEKESEKGNDENNSCKWSVIIIQWNIKFQAKVESV